MPISASVIVRRHAPGAPHAGSSRRWISRRCGARFARAVGRPRASRRRENPAASALGGGRGPHLCVGSILGEHAVSRRARAAERRLSCQRLRSCRAARSRAASGVALLFGAVLPDRSVDEGLRARMRTGLAGVTSPTTLGELDDAFLDLLVQLTSEGAFAAPEYGGNVNGAGWRLCSYEGDAQPFGFSSFDEVAGVYRERVASPVSIANPGADPDPLDDAVRAAPAGCRAPRWPREPAMKRTVFGNGALQSFDVVNVGSACGGRGRGCVDRERLQRARARGRCQPLRFSGRRLARACAATLKRRAEEPAPFHPAKPDRRAPQLPPQRRRR